MMHLRLAATALAVLLTLACASQGSGAMSSPSSWATT
jgi:hypothetical protein